MKTLQTLLQQAENERDQALAMLRRAEDQARRVAAQAEQLVAHRADYERRWTLQFRQRGTIEIVQHYSNFMGRLDDALVQQRSLSTQHDANVERLRARWVAAETRAAAVRKLIERRQSEADRVQARRDQKQTDEMAQQLHRARTALADGE